MRPACAAPCPPAEKRRGRDNLYDVVQHTCNLKPSGYTGGDLWLEAKGKAQAMGPEERRGRLSGARELVSQPETLQGKRPGPGQSYGDLWLDAKGKCMVEGPEQRRGRPNLYETFHQLSNPYVDGRTLGDAWLEKKGRRVDRPGDNDLRSMMTDIIPPPGPRPPVDERKYGSRIVTDMGQVTSRV